MKTKERFQNGPVRVWLPARGLFDDIWFCAFFPYPEGCADGLLLYAYNFGLFDSGIGWNKARMSMKTKDKVRKSRS
jgi:hypothetical protein